jgi:hypothetical protein
MTIQTCITLLLALLCALYFLKGLLRPARGGCGSGCGSCKSGCPVKQLEALQPGLDKPRKHSA